MIKATFKTPKLTTKTVWAGMYGGHYSAIVFFKKKPKKSKEPYHLSFLKGTWYDQEDYKELTVGAMWLREFKEIFPDADLTPYLNEHGQPKEIEITEVFQIQLTAPWGEDGELISIELRADGY